MSLKEKTAGLMTKVSRSVHKTGFEIKKHSPEILIVTGVIGVVVSGIMACKATTKVGDVLDKAKLDVDDIHADMEMDDGKGTIAEDCKKELAGVYVRTGFELVKLYAPSVILGSLSLTAIVTSNNILRKRNIALAAAYAGVEKSFKEYRGRVIERFGEELDKELRYNIKQKEIEEKVVNEDGTESTVKKTVAVVDPNSVGDTSVIFYEGCRGFTKSAEANLFYLRKVQAFANEKLREQGYLYLNDVLAMLGFNAKVCGQVIGWIYDEKNPVGDNFVDFGLLDTSNGQTMRFLDGAEPCVILNFNHDGYILDELIARGILPA